MYWLKREHELSKSYSYGRSLSVHIVRMVNGVAETFSRPQIDGLILSRPLATSRSEIWFEQPQPQETKDE